MTLGLEQLRFGNALRRIRGERCLTQEQFADLSGLHKNYISPCERGTRNNGLKNILALAQALQAKPGEFLVEGVNRTV